MLTLIKSSLPFPSPVRKQTDTQASSGEPTRRHERKNPPVGHPITEIYRHAIGSRTCPLHPKKKIAIIYHWMRCGAVR